MSYKHKITNRVFLRLYKILEYIMNFAYTIRFKEGGIIVLLKVDFKDTMDLKKLRFKEILTKQQYCNNKGLNLFA